jgi:hypothetical protein
MRNTLKIFVASIAIAASAPAVAQYTFTQPGQSPQPVQQLQIWNNVARVNLGVGFYNEGYYNCSYWYPYYSCNSGSYTSYIPFIVGPQVDFALSGMNNISVGFTVSMGTVSTDVCTTVSNCGSKSASITIWEPTVDYVAKFGPPTQDTVGRFRLGGGMYIGPNSNIGGAFRIGGGASFLSSNRFGIGLDLVLEGGGYNGNWVGGLQLLASPEFHF